MQTVVRARRAQDFLALVPQLVGVQPRNSLVVVCFRGSRSRAAVRFSLPGHGGDVANKRFVVSVIGTLCRLSAIDSIVPVVYTDESFGQPEGPPRAALVARLAARARSAGFHLNDCLCVARDAWGSYLGAGAPAKGRSLSLISASRLLEALPAPLQRAPLSSEDHAAVPAPDPERAAAVARELRRLEQAAPCPEPDEPASRALHTRILAALTRAEGPADSPPSPSALAELVRWAQHPFVPPLLALTIGWPRGFGSLPPPGTAVNALSGHCAMSPDPERVTRAIAAIKYALSSAPRSAAVPLIPLLAWLYWSLGLGSVGQLLLDRLGRPPADVHILAVILEPLIRSGQLPDWTFTRQ